ncbi:acyl-CoA thioesterase FadM [Azospirillum lipoferum]|uniref:Thioesterase n=1 Tax=Azospirillum lipoferum TaxID=193 RepID=A0A5A9FZI5_AZOLI|nr:MULTISPECIES: thioesterase family protein [Azospirillum]KAA0586509.1 thioesterase [Azospirillum lipoferum]MCP1615335.1 acyl-CoA thioesterase FadM [Azospirillum lipoferum]MDW5534136.1 thioesterase family protein [Azospirillum sp. NL1]
MSGTENGETAEPPAILTPLRLHRTSVIPEWVDYNGHLSEAYYVLIFGHATDALMDALGMDAAYRERTGRSLYTVDARIRYLLEAHQGEGLEVRTWIAGADAKRLLVVHRMHRLPAPGAGTSASDPVAETELVLLSVGRSADRPNPQAMPFEAPVRTRIRRIAAAHLDSAPTLPGRWMPPEQRTEQRTEQRADNREAPMPT